jgi:hypothetical protein
MAPNPAIKIPQISGRIRTIKIPQKQWLKSETKKFRKNSGQNQNHKFSEKIIAETRTTKIPYINGPETDHPKIPQTNSFLCAQAKLHPQKRWNHLAKTPLIKEVGSELKPTPENQKLE